MIRRPCPIEHLGGFGGRLVAVAALLSLGSPPMEQITRTPKQLGTLLLRRRRERGLSEEALASRRRWLRASTFARQQSPRPKTRPSTGAGVRSSIRSGRSILNFLFDLGAKDRLEKLSSDSDAQATPECTAQNLALSMQRLLKPSPFRSPPVFPTCGRLNERLKNFLYFV